MKRLITLYETLIQDLRFSLRTLAKNRGFAAVTVLTLALGIGANTAIFSVVDAVLLDVLPYPHPETLVRIIEHAPRVGDMTVSWPNFLDWQKQNHVFALMAVYHAADYNLTGVEEPVRLRAIQASASFFGITGVVPARGRAFAAAEDRPGGPPVALLSHALWRSRFGSDPRVLGRPVLLNGVSYTVIGVLPAAFWLPQPVDVMVPFAPIATGKDWLDRGDHNGLRAIARLRPGVSLAQAAAEMSTIARRLEQQYPRSNSGDTALIKTFHDDVVEGVRPTLYVLLAAVAFVLLTACANVANLLLARASARQREMAVRAALGCGRGRLVLQALIESLMLSALGGAAGLVLALAGIRPLLALAPQDVPRLQNVHLDARVLGFTIAVSLLAGLVFGIVPALQTSRPDLALGLKDAARGASAGRSRSRLRGAVLVTEVALALVLVTGAGLMIRSIVAVQGTPLGFRPDNLLTFGVKLPEARYPKEQQARFFQQALDRISAVPGVLSTASVRCLPMAGGCWDSVYLLSDRPVPAQADIPDFDSNMVSTDYFQTLGIPVVAGRGFTRQDDAKAPLVAIVNQALARRMWPHASPLGKRLRQGFPQDHDQPWREIVGVVGDVKREGPDAKQSPEVFMPLTQHAFWQGSTNLVVRTAQEPMSAARAVAAAIQTLDKDQPLTDVQPMTRYMGDALARRRFSTLLLGVFGGIALLLAAIGIYGVMGYTVSLRMREMGIRMALGARRADVFRLVVGQGLGLAALGVAGGLLASLAMTRFMSKLLFGVSATDPATFAAVALLLAAAAALASFLPARRATDGDPLLALRHE